MSESMRELFYQHQGKLIHKWDHYLEIYDKYFSRFRGKELHMLEIGISHGGSMQLWKKYFGPQARIYAIDINPECKKLEEENTRVFIGSQSDRNFLNQVMSELPPLDIILDDGGHTMEQQIVSFETLYLKVKEGGLYMVEDTHTSYFREYEGGLRKKGSFIEYAKRLIDTLYEGYLKDKQELEISEITRHINGIAFYDSIVIFDKQKRPAPFHLKKGKETVEQYYQRLKKPSILERLFNKNKIRDFQSEAKNFSRKPD